MEHRLCQLAIEANRYDVKNGNDPTPGNPSEEKQSELEDFIDYAKVIVGTLGHKVFEPLIGRAALYLQMKNVNLRVKVTALRLELLEPLMVLL